MDPLVLERIVDELKPALKGGIVSRVHQPDERTVILRVYTGRGERRLLISTHPSLCRMHLTGTRPENPPRPPRFCAFLRSRVTNARVDDIATAPGERIARVHLVKRGDDGLEEFYLVAELTGKSANIILTDGGGVVLDALKHFPAESSVRAVEPGVLLEPLPTPPPAPRVEGGEPFGREPGETWNEAADRFYSALSAGEGEVLELNELGRIIRKALKKARRKLANLASDREKAERGLEGYALGELLVSNLHAFKRGMKEVRLTDYTKVPPEEVDVPLDETLGPKENAERYFKRAKKSKTGLQLLAERIPETEREVEYLEGLLYQHGEAGQHGEAETEEEIEELRRELAEGGYLKKVREGRAKERAAAAEPVRRFTSSEGFEVVCGKSGRGNDMIVGKLARNDDIWFHVQGCPGSHVLVKVAGRAGELTRKTIEEAAALAAWHSKARGAAKVDVIYTEARNVKKPRGAKPGLVTVKEHKAIRVRPADMEEG